MSARCAPAPPGLWAGSRDCSSRSSALLKDGIKVVGQHKKILRSGQLSQPRCSVERPVFPDEPDLSFLRFRLSYQRPDSVKYDLKLRIIFILISSSLFASSSWDAIISRSLTKARHDLDIHFDRTIAVQNTGEHGNTLLLRKHTVYIFSPVPQTEVTNCDLKTIRS